MKTILNTLISAIRIRLSKFILVFTKLINPQYISLTLQRYVGTFFSRLLDVKPRDKKDYYTIFNWMMSKRLAYSLVIIVGVCCATYIFMMSPASMLFSHGANTNLPTYNYNSLGVKNFTGQANIRAADKYTAYTGDLDKGVVSGTGKLFDKDGNVIYEGEFAGNMFNGIGQLNHKNGNAKYIGDFVNNEFQGNGSLYRENLTRKYTGQFAGGYMNGDGTLFDETEKLIFTGKFENDEISYQTLLSSSTAENAKLYTGTNVIYNLADGSSYAVYMEQIDAVGVVNASEDSILDKQPVEKIIVLKNTLYADKKELNTQEQLGAYFEKKIYEGLTMIQFGEVAAFLSLDDQDSGAYIDKGTIAFSKPFAEVCNVTSFDATKEIYIRAYVKNGLVYTFYYADKNSPFVMYSIEMAAIKEEV